MIEAFQNINKAFESKVRLGIMAVLMVNDEADFNSLKELRAILGRWKSLVILSAGKLSWEGRRKPLSKPLRKGGKHLKRTLMHWKVS